MPRSSGEDGRAGTHGGLHTMSGARPSGKRSAPTTSTRPASFRRPTFSRAQASARGEFSVAITRAMPRRESTAASTPVPVPTSNARPFDFNASGSGARATRSTYSPRTGANTP